MKFLVIYTVLIFQNNLEQLQLAEKVTNLSQLISILTVGFLTILLLLIINLIKVNKLKKKIKFLEENDK